MIDSVAYHTRLLPTWSPGGRDGRGRMPLTQGRVTQVAQAAHASFGTESAVGTRAADPSKGSYAQRERTPLRCRKVVARGVNFRFIENDNGKSVEIARIITTQLSSCQCR